MARCDECKANKVCDHNRFGFEKCGNFIPADVVPKSEVERLERILNSYALQYGTVRDKQKVIDKAKSEALLDLKRKIHDKAVYPHNAGINPYVNLKTFDAVLNNCIKKYTEGGDV